MQQVCPKITVVTVCYNAIEGIEQTILSVVNQTYQNIEYIIIDGGSTDGTVDIIRMYTDKIAYWVSESDKGIYDAMNKGIEKATGDWINFMNAGDSFWSSQTVEQVIAFSKQNADSDVLFGDCGYLNSDVVSPPHPFWLNKKKYQGIGFCHQATYFRVALLKHYKYNLEFSLCADFDLCWRLYKDRCTFSYIGYPLCRFDTTGVSFSVKNRMEVVKQNARIAKCNNSLKYWVSIVKIQLLYLMPSRIQHFIVRHYQNKESKRYGED